MDSERVCMENNSYLNQIKVLLNLVPRVSLLPANIAIGGKKRDPGNEVESYCLKMREDKRGATRPENGKINNT